MKKMKQIKIPTCLLIIALLISSCGLSPEMQQKKKDAIARVKAEAKNLSLTDANFLAGVVGASNWVPDGYAEFYVTTDNQATFVARVEGVYGESKISRASLSNAATIFVVGAGDFYINGEKVTINNQARMTPIDALCWFDMEPRICFYDLLATHDVYTYGTRSLFNLNIVRVSVGYQ